MNLDSKKITWSDDLLIGDHKIDRQHQQIFRIINEFVNEQSLNPKSRNLAKILSKLTDYGQEHFKTEERHMSIYNYPKLEEQKNAHLQYTYKIASFNSNFNSNNPTDPSEVINYIQQWWLNHIKTMDFEYQNFILNKKNGETF